MWSRVLSFFNTTPGWQSEHIFLPAGLEDCVSFLSSWLRTSHAELLFSSHVLLMFVCWVPANPFRFDCRPRVIVKETGFCHDFLDFPVFDAWSFPKQRGEGRCWKSWNKQPGYWCLVSYQRLWRHDSLLLCVSIMQQPGKCCDFGTLLFG